MDSSLEDKIGDFGTSPIVNLKIEAKYALPKLLGLKPFEIRFNDRNYKKGQLICYTVIDDEDLNNYFLGRIYEITYVTDYAQENGFVVFADKFYREVFKYK